MSENHVPADLLSIIKRDLQPVQPLPSPAHRALKLLPLGLFLLIGLPVFWSWRTHINGFAPWTAWPLSVLETAAGLLVLALGFREAIPGRELTTKTLSTVISLSWFGFLIINAASGTQFPFVASNEERVHWIWECIGMATAFSVPALAIPAYLVSRALPNRPKLTGALYGLGIGLMADAGLRLFCWDSERSHVVIAHGGAMAILMALGALSAMLVERFRGRGGFARK